MEFVRHHVAASGSTSLKGFYASENVDYDPPSNSLRENIKKAKCQRVYTLASGATGDAEEREIRDTMVSANSSKEMIRMFFAMRGWEGLDDELEEAYLDPIAARTAEVLDWRDYIPWQLIRQHLPLLDHNGPLNLGDVFLKIRTWPLPYQPFGLDRILGTRPEIYRRIASATMRRRESMTQAARVPAFVITAYDTAAPPVHRRNELFQMMHQINYTTRICVQLEIPRYDDLYNVLLDMADPAIDARQRLACHDAVDFLKLEFAAAQDAVKFAGENSAKTLVQSFMTARQAALDAWAPNVPPGTILTALINAIQPALTTLNQLRTFVVNIPDIASEITLPKLLDTDGDDVARNFVSSAKSQNWLDRVAARVKVKAIQACLDGSTGDDDEIAILSCLSAAKAYDQAELYQLAAAATWEALYSSIDGDEYDQLETLLDQPT
ncbi:hypothetical protein ABGN05_07215 [Aquibium sp. LZ166]|uniref:Uncharacterized protein n=1 Tax=Aquibium pacificus TaxID=3153579 RepID=A0ABV3SFW8_9HYPH